MLARPQDDLSMFTAPDHLLAARQASRKNSTADQAMRRTIQEIASSVDPNVKLDPDVEDVSLFL